MESMNAYETMENPFTPGFGQLPLVLAGREGITEDLRRALDSQRRRPELSMLFEGPRGSGKTAMLLLASDLALESGWVPVMTSSAPGMLEDILEQARRKGSHLLAEPKSQTLRSIQFGGVGIEWDTREACAGNWRSRMTDVLETLNAQGAGLLIAVDEVNPRVEELELLCSVYQNFIGEGRKVALMLAGLPSRISMLLADDSPTSFLRRAQLRRLERISNASVANALATTVEESGKEFEGDALALAVEAIDGYAYMIQLLGFRAWDQSGDAPSITKSDMEAAIARAMEDVREQILKPTYRELSDGDIAFLEAMLQDEHESSLADIGQRLGVKSNYASKYKTRLLEQGVVAETLRRKLRFDLPFFRDFVQEVSEGTA